MRCPTYDGEGEGPGEVGVLPMTVWVRVDDLPMTVRVRVLVREVSYL